MDEKSSAGTTVLLVVLTILAIPVGVFMCVLYGLAAGQHPELLVFAFTLPVLVIIVGTLRSIRHRNLLASTAITSMLCVVMLLAMAVQFTPLGYLLF
jgi:hypothetical protein